MIFFGWSQAFKLHLQIQKQRIKLKPHLTGKESKGRQPLTHCFCNHLSDQPLISTFTIQSQSCVFFATLTSIHCPVHWPTGNSEANRLNTLTAMESHSITNVLDTLSAWNQLWERTRVEMWCHTWACPKPQLLLVAMKANWQDSTKQQPIVDPGDSLIVKAIHGSIGLAFWWLLAILWQRF